MNFVWLFNSSINNSILSRSKPEKKLPFMFADNGYGDIFKSMENIFLPFFEVDKLGEVNHVEQKKEKLNRLVLQASPFKLN